MQTPQTSAIAANAPVGRLTPVLLRSAVVAALGGLLFGFDTAVIAGATQALTEAYQLTPGTLGFTVSIAVWGTVLGAATGGMFGDKYGRRDSLRGLALLYLVSALGCAFAWNWTALVTMRFIVGIAIGGSSVLGPMYIAEVAPARLRGRLVGLFQFNVVAGILLAYLSNYLVGLGHFGDHEWRVKLGVSAVPALLFFLMLFTIPRSPRWLVKKGRVDEARDVLKVTGEENYEQELKDIVDSIDAEHHRANEPLFSSNYKLPIFLAITIGFFNQLAGINAILYYLNDIFARAGFSKVSGDLQAVAIGATNLLFTMVGLSVIDKIGRKALLLIGAAGTSLCLAGVAAVFFTNSHQNLLLPLLVIYIGFFALSQGAVIWVYIGEIFPNRVRGKGQSLGSFSHWIMNAAISFIYPIIAVRSGGYPFLFFSVMTVVQFFTVLFIYPETKGFTLEEMQHKLGIK
ncbi:MAG TPA: sugar porter family MFS transporter [Terriglobales bacterium]|nr:sugar porter family MFS transporter [Terriglobales bacterium]